MSLLATVNTASDVAVEKDILGYAGLFESGVYAGEITLMYLGVAKSGAINVTIHFKTDDGRDFRNTTNITSGDAKGKKTYYENKQGEKHNLPGFTVAEAIALMTTGKGILELAGETEKKVVSLYNFDQRKEVPTEVECVVPAMGQRVKLGVIKKVEDKRAKGDDGKYYATGETREVNEIDKVFRDRDGMTVAEIVNEATEATFIERWSAKNTGKTQDRSTGAAGGQGQAGAPRQAANQPNAGAPAAAGKPTKSLFA